MVEPAKELVLVTGCSGRIGMRVAERLHDRFHVVGFDVVEPRQSGIMDFFHVDLTSDESVKAAFASVREQWGDRIASVIHLAAYYSFSGEHPELYDIVTVQGTEKVLRAAKDFQCEQFLFSSTMLVHAPCAVGEKISEDSPVEAKWDYPKSKVATEELITREHGTIPIVILRIAGCYSDDCESIPISNQIQRIYEHQLTSKLFPGDLSHGAAFLHLDDLVDAIELCVNKRKTLPSECTLLIGEDKTMSYDALQRRIASLLFGTEIATCCVPKWFAKWGAWMQNHTPFMEKTFIKPWMIDIADDNYAINIDKARQLLGWEPKHFVGDTLAPMIERLKEDPAAWYRKNGLTMPRHLMDASLAATR